MFIELCQFLLKLGRRCVRANSLPAESNCQGVLNLSFSDAKPLPVEYFIVRSKLGAKLDVCCKQKAEKEMGDEQNRTLGLDKVTANNREEFGRAASGYVVHLLKTSQGLTLFTSDIVKGLGSFDLETMLVDPLDHATFCFNSDVPA